MLSLVESTSLFTKLKYGDEGNCGLFEKSGVAVKITFARRTVHEP